MATPQERQDQVDSIAQYLQWGIENSEYRDLLETHFIIKEIIDGLKEINSTSLHSLLISIRALKNAIL